MLRTTEINEAWEAGLSKVEVFDSELQAVWYLTKGLCYDEEDAPEPEISEGMYGKIFRWKKARGLPILRPPTTEAVENTLRKEEES